MSTKQLYFFITPKWITNPWHNSLKELFQAPMSLLISSWLIRINSPQLPSYTVPRQNRGWARTVSAHLSSNNPRSGEAAPWLRSGYRLCGLENTCIWLAYSILAGARRHMESSGKGNERIQRDTDGLVRIRINLIWYPWIQKDMNGLKQNLDGFRCNCNG